MGARHEYEVYDIRYDRVEGNACTVFAQFFEKPKNNADSPVRWSGCWGIVYNTEIQIAECMIGAVEGVCKLT